MWLSSNAKHKGKKKLFFFFPNFSQGSEGFLFVCFRVGQEKETKMLQP